MLPLAARLPRGARITVLVWGTASLAGLLVLAAHLCLGLGRSDTWTYLLDGWLYESLVVSGAVGVLMRAALVREDRLAWSLIGLGVLSWAGADSAWWAAYGNAESAPYPAATDLFYLLLYPLTYAGLVLLVRDRLRHFQASQWLDGLAASLAVGAVGTAVVLPRVVAATGGDVAATATNFAYPLGDLLILSLVVAAAGLLGRGAGRAMLVLAVAAATFGVADSVYLLLVARGSYVEGGALDLLWPLASLMMALAAWQPVSARRVSLEGWRVLVLPAVVAVVSLVVLVMDPRGDYGAVATILAASALALCLVRAGLTFRENLALTEGHRRQAVTDALTGLPNRRLFDETATRAVERARRDGSRVAVMIIDLDRFKEINDTLGHGAGDTLLQEVAWRLRSSVRGEDTVARMGGDEFAVLLVGVAEVAAAEGVATTLVDAIGRPVAVGDLSLDVDASIGIAVFPDHAHDVETLVQRADVAMYAAKSQNLGVVAYAPEIDHHSPERLMLVGELRRAIERGELLLHYQPKFLLGEDAVVGVEALLRWSHPVRGLLGPAEFIPLAEHTALIRPLTIHVIDRALTQAREWAERDRPLPVAVNVSARNLLDERFPTDVAACLARRGVPASRLELEITESVLMANPARALDVLNRLHDMGVTLSIDDFGIGYSSLNYLKTLPIDVLKIDKSFVVAMSSSRADAMIVRSTIDLARNLGLRVVAEGIETRESYDELQEIGCHFGQGFLLGRPLPADQLDGLIAAGGGAVEAAEREAAASGPVAPAPPAPAGGAPQSAEPSRPVPG